MFENDRFSETWERDAEGIVRIRVTCKKCGAFQLVNIIDHSLEKWERNHTCPDPAKIP